jgi:ribosome-binding factor A
MWKITLISVYNFHTASSFNANAGKVMKKLMGQTWKKKKIFSEYNAFPNPEMFSKGSQEGRYSGSARRVSVLNKLFMKHITDLLSTGEYSSEFSAYGIEINRVQISPDYMALNVFWVARNAQNDEIVEKLLKKNAGFLRHELSSLRVMGVVPIIQFVKDKHFSKIVEVESRLAKADFGEDHIPTEMATKLKSQMELFAPLPSAVKVFNRYFK